MEVKKTYLSSIYLQWYILTLCMLMLKNHTLSKQTREIKQTITHGKTFCPISDLYRISAPNGLSINVLNLYDLNGPFIFHLDVKHCHLMWYTD